MSLSNYLEDALLDHVTGNATYTAPANIYVKLHTGDPGEAGTANAATETTRVLITFDASSSGTAAQSNTPSWTSVSTTETYSHISLWDNLTVGNCLGSGALTASKAVTAGDNFELSSTDWTLD